MPRSARPRSFAAACACVCWAATATPSSRFTEAINLNPDLAEAYFRRGICFYYMSEDELAVARLQARRQHRIPGSAAASSGKVSPMPSSATTTKRSAAYGAALAESDRYVPAYVNRGLAYMMLGENDKALADFNAAIRLEPAEWTHYFKRGIAYERLGKQQQAADSFVNAVRFDEQVSARLPPRRRLRSPRSATTSSPANTATKPPSSKPSRKKKRSRKAARRSQSLPRLGSAKSRLAELRPRASLVTPRPRPLYWPLDAELLWLPAPCSPLPAIFGSLRTWMVPRSRFSPGMSS